MGELSQADQYLLEGIRRGDSDAWRQLVDRYRGRLVAFARSRLRSDSDAEDVLQETFMTFLKGVAAFRGEAALETYLFTILRRRLVDHFRGRRLNVCLLSDVIRRDGDEPDEPIAQVASPDPTASWYVRRDEREGLRREALAEAIRRLINGYKKALNFRDLKIVEMLFYCQLANKQVAGVIGLDEKQVALIKHRCLKKVRENVARELRARRLTVCDEEADDARCEALLTQIWESMRLSCPKRTTVGAFHLGTLDDAWHDYVAFHLHRLGCQFCLANLEDLKRQDDEAASSAALRDRIMESTVGFLRQSYLAGPGGGRG